MKARTKLAVLSLLLGLATAASAVDKAELDNRIRAFTAKFEALQQKPDKAIPVETLRKAHGIVLLDRTKAGFVFAFQGGSGVALVKNAESGQWSPAAWMAANEASLGFQLGGQQSFVVLLLMTTNATRALIEANLEFGGEARGTAGDTSSGAEGKIQSKPASVLVYDDTKGLYGGAAVKAGALAPDPEANRVYYDQFLTMQEILFDRKVKPTEAVTGLITKFNEQSKLSKK